MVVLTAAEDGSRSRGKNRQRDRNGGRGSRPALSCDSPPDRSIEFGADVGNRVEKDVVGGPSGFRMRRMRRRGARVGGAARCRPEEPRRGGDVPGCRPPVIRPIDARRGRFDQSTRVIEVGVGW